jgi:cytochrome c peroxidase
MELLETLQAKRAREAERQPTVEALPVMSAERRAEALSFLTLGTVEGIVEGTNPTDLAEPAEQTTWNAKLEKFMSLSETYSSNNTISGETCYMVETALYKDILLAVAARNQNQHVLLAAAEQLESHISQIEDSHERISERKK